MPAAHSGGVGATPGSVVAGETDAFAEATADGAAPLIVEPIVTMGAEPESAPTDRRPPTQPQTPPETRTETRNQSARTGSSAETETDSRAARATTSPLGTPAQTPSTPVVPLDPDLLEARIRRELESSTQERLARAAEAAEKAVIKPPAAREATPPVARSAPPSRSPPERTQKVEPVAPISPSQVASQTVAPAQTKRLPPPDAQIEAAPKQTSKPAPKPTPEPKPPKIDPAAEGARITARLQSAYQQGNPGNFAGLFTANAAINEGMGKPLIRGVYGDLFRRTPARRLTISGMRWSSTAGGKLTGSGRVSVSNQYDRGGAWRHASGNIQLDLVPTGGGYRIARMHYQLD
jgi:hypothetical protein